jgi:hypothetical protein
VYKIITGREEVKYTFAKDAVCLEIRVYQFLFFVSENHEFSMLLEILTIYNMKVYFTVVKSN